MSENDHLESPNRPIRGAVEDAVLNIKIIGVGGAGNNAVDRLKMDDLSHVGLAVINTDSKTLNASPIAEKLMIGRTVTRGLSTGGEADIGRQAAESDREAISRLVEGVDLVFILAGLGGGSGSGASPVIADMASDSGALVISFVTLPFTREGQRRHKQAEDALGLLRRSCHAVITLPNDLLLQEIEEKSTLLDAFAIADDWIYRGVRAIVSMLNDHGLINVDFATLTKAFSSRGGKTLFGLAVGTGPDVVGSALRELEVCPLLHLPENKYVRKADSLIVNITGGPDLSMAMVNEVLDAVTEKFSSRENTVIGAVIDGSLHNRLHLCVIGATDVDGKRYRSARYRGYREQGHTAQPAFVESRSQASDRRRDEAGVSGAGTGESPALPADDTEPVRETATVGEPVAQEEFPFSRIDDSRGFFEETESNMYDGVDLDIPTFLRRGIRIHV